MAQTPLSDYLRVQLAADSELRRVLELAARRSSSTVKGLDLGEGTNFGDRVRIAQFQQVTADIAKIQNELWQQGVGPIITRNYPKAQNAADRSFSAIEKDLLKSTGDKRAAQQLINQARRTVSQGLSLDRVRRVRDLSPSVYKNADLASGRVQRTIRAGIIRGLSAEELAKEVSRYISPRVKGGVAYAALRLARTELNNAFHESQKLKAQDAPWVKGLKWNRSGSHPKRDACDDLAEANDYGLGKGIYPADRVPDKPHPQCLCYTTYETVSESEMLSLLPNNAGRLIA